MFGDRHVEDRTTGRQARCRTSDRVDRRRWCLNPRMRETGPGQPGRYATIYAMDSRRLQVRYGQCRRFENDVGGFKPPAVRDDADGTGLEPRSQDIRGGMTEVIRGE